MLHTVLSAGSAPQLLQCQQKQIEILEAASATEDLLYECPE